MKTLIYKPTQNRKTHEIIMDIKGQTGVSINIIFTDNLCMLGAQTGDRIIKEVSGTKVYHGHPCKSTISVHCESEDVEGITRDKIPIIIFGLINSAVHGVRNIITLTNGIRLPQMITLFELLTSPDSFGRPPLIPTYVNSLNLYFDEADKTMSLIQRHLSGFIDKPYVNDFYITATPKRVLKHYKMMRLHPVTNLLANYISLDNANWVTIEHTTYMESVRYMLDDISTEDGGSISQDRFMFAPGVNLKESHYEIADESTNVFGCISLVVNSDGLVVYLPSTLKSEYMSTTTSLHGRIPKIPLSFKSSLNQRYPIHQTSGSTSYYKLTFSKKTLITGNENEFWKVVGIARDFWRKHPIVITGSRCVERGITIQDPSSKSHRFTDGVLHGNIARGDSGSQMAGRFTLTYNHMHMKPTDFTPINIYSSETTKLFMINQEKKAKYAVELSAIGKHDITYDEWRNFERTSVLGTNKFKTYKGAIRHAARTFTGNINYRVNYKEGLDYFESEDRLGSCNLIKEGIYEGLRYNSFDNKDKIPIAYGEFEHRKTRHLCWREHKIGNVYRIWAVYKDLSDASTLRYYLCYTPLALCKDLGESESDSDS